MPILGPLWLSFQDFPGAKDAADLLKKIEDTKQLDKDGEAALAAAVESFKKSF